MAAQQPSYPTMTEAELLETICWSRNASSTEITRPSGIFTFGQYNPRMYTTRPGVYLSSPLTPNGRGMTFDNIVTLTDQKTFAISVNCWRGPGVDASSYMILSQTSQLQDPGTWRRINGHLANLGFRPNDLLVLRNENCSWRKNPALEEWTKVRSGPRSRYPESAVPPRQQRVPIGNYNQGSRFGKGSWQGWKIKWKTDDFQINKFIIL